MNVQQVEGKHERRESCENKNSCFETQGNKSKQRPQEKNAFISHRLRSYRRGEATNCLAKRTTYNNTYSSTSVQSFSTLSCGAWRHGVFYQTSAYSSPASSTFESRCNSSNHMENSRIVVQSRYRCSHLRTTFKSQQRNRVYGSASYDCG